jgi:hypothetical protein
MLVSWSAATGLIVGMRALGTLPIVLDCVASDRQACPRHGDGDRPRASEKELCWHPESPSEWANGAFQHRGEEELPANALMTTGSPVVGLIGSSAFSVLCVSSDA